MLREWRGVHIAHHQKSTLVLALSEMLAVVIRFFALQNKYNIRAISENIGKQDRKAKYRW